MAPPTERDIQVVLDLYEHRYLTTSQIQRLHFPSLQTANRRLRSLVENKLVAHFTVSTIDERLYHITDRGAALVAEQRSTNKSELHWSRTTKPPKDHYFVRHFIAVNDFRIDLTDACQKSSSQLKLLGFIPEHFYQLKRRGRPIKYITDVIIDRNNPVARISHTPDAVFALRKADKSVLFYLEIDRGTEVETNPEKGVLKMVRFYLKNAETKRYKRYEQDFSDTAFRDFRLLIVTTSQERLQNIRQASQAVYQSRLRFFWITTFDHIASQSIIGQRLWVSLDPHDQQTYAIG